MDIFPKQWLLNQDVGHHMSRLVGEELEMLQYHLFNSYVTCWRWVCSRRSEPELRGSFWASVLLPLNHWQTSFLWWSCLYFLQVFCLISPSDNITLWSGGILFVQEDLFAAGGPIWDVSFSSLNVRFSYSQVTNGVWAIFISLGRQKFLCYPLWGGNPDL